MLSNITSISYALAALGFFALCGLLVTRWRGRSHASVLTIASLITALWSCAIAAAAIKGNGWSLLTDVFEVLREVGAFGGFFSLEGLPRDAALVACRRSLARGR